MRFAIGSPLIRPEKGEIVLAILLENPPNSSVATSSNRSGLA